MSESLTVEGWRIRDDLAVDVVGALELPVEESSKRRRYRRGELVRRTLLLADVAGLVLSFVLASLLVPHAGATADRVSSGMEYLALPRATEAAYREALAVLAEYQHPDSLTAAKHASGTRPALSEVHVDPHNGFSLFLYDGGAEIRLGRGGITDKLARLDEILTQFGSRGLAALRIVHLDGPAGDRVPIRLAAAAAEAPAPASEPARPSGSPRATAQRPVRAERRR